MTQARTLCRAPSRRARGARHRRGGRRPCGTSSAPWCEPAPGPGRLGCCCARRWRRPGRPGSGGHRRRRPRRPGLTVARMDFPYRKAGRKVARPAARPGRRRPREAARLAPRVLGLVSVAGPWADACARWPLPRGAGSRPGADQLPAAPTRTPRPEADRALSGALGALPVRLGNP